tara:strand:+ start:3680 stop:4417 length:738 start_codon:yes stop_codon:yes gene_type:complete
MFFNFIKNLKSLSQSNNIIVKNLGKFNYADCFEYQKKIQNEIIQIKLDNRNKRIKKITPNYLLFVEHDHVYTLGNSGNSANLLFNEKILKQKGIEFYKTNRGGDITYHGPGQLVCYPIIDMENFYTDIHKYLRDLEEIIINTLNVLGITASGNSNETGVWIDVGKLNERKICAMGIKVSRWVTMHGLALNVNTNLSFFEGIIPCGISNKGVTSISNELNKEIKMDLVKKIFTEKFLDQFNATVKI